MGSSTDIQKYQVSWDKLRRSCEPDTLGFHSTQDLPSLPGVIRQERFQQGLAMGLTMRDKSSGIRVIVEGGTSRSSAVMGETRDFINEHWAEAGANVKDLCYVFNFADLVSPLPLFLPKGKGKLFKEAVETARKSLTDAMTARFGSFQFMNRYDEIFDPVRTLVTEKKRILDEAVGTKTGGMNFTDAASSVRWEGNYFILPSIPSPAQLSRVKGVTSDMVLTVHGSGDQKMFVVHPNSIWRWLGNLGLEKEERKPLYELITKANEEISVSWRQAIKGYNDHENEAAGKVFDEVTQDLGIKEAYPQAHEFLDGLRQFVIDHHQMFHARGAPEPPSGIIMDTLTNPMRAFMVNVQVDNSELEDKVPVVFEYAPTAQNLFGQINGGGGYSLLPGGGIVQGSADHTSLQAGSLLRANGGVLIIPLRTMLMSANGMLTWQVLVQALQYEQITIEDIAERAGMIVIGRSATVTPKPVPLKVRVILLVDHKLDSLCSIVFPQEYRLFRARAEFVSRTERNSETEKELAQFLGDSSKKEGLLHCNAGAVAAMVEHSSWLAEDSRKLSLLFGDIKDVLLQADYWARERALKKGAEAKEITSEDVREALEQQAFRADAIREIMLELKRDGTYKLEISGERVGAANGLTVYSPPELSFGMPFVESATVWPGRFQIINVEGEIGLSGPTHQKSFHIIRGVLATRYGDKVPLSLAAQLVSEQIYSGIEGDSASVIELVTVLSALADVPLKQATAVTGSCNQLGEVQAIGGVNQKTEGMFDACKAMRGELLGDQGVIIPWDNLNELMLRPDVVEAVKEGKFHVYAVKTIDEATHILTGLEAGEWDKEKKEYPEGTLNHLVLERLREFAALAKNWSIGKEESVSA